MLEELEPQAPGEEQGEGPAITAPPLSPDHWGSICWAPKLTFFLGPSVLPLQTHLPCRRGSWLQDIKMLPGPLPGLFHP